MEKTRVRKKQTVLIFLEYSMDKQFWLFSVTKWEDSSESNYFLSICLLQNYCINYQPAKLDINSGLIIRAAIPNLYLLPPH